MEKLFDLIKVNKNFGDNFTKYFFRITGNRYYEFSRLCEREKTTENAFNSAVMEQVNAVSATCSSDNNDFCTNLPTN